MTYRGSSTDSEALSFERDNHLKKIITVVVIALSVTGLAVGTVTESVAHDAGGIKIPHPNA